MNKHTPGPWVQSGTHGHRFIGPAASEEGCIAIACKVDGKDGWIEMSANAALIAAAPDLFNVADLVIRRIETCLADECDMGSGTMNRILDDARAAIARAKGEK